jgi:hypothetical protein
METRIQSDSFVREPKTLSLSLITSVFSVTWERAAESRCQFAGAFSAPQCFLTGLSSPRAREWGDR